MSVAICIPTYNQAEYLPLAINSALNQKGIEPEAWIADDCSQDATSEVIQPFLKDARVRYIRNSQNLGIAKNVDQLLGQPRTDFIVRLDSDDVLFPDYCRTLVELLQRNPEAAMAHAAVQEIDNKGQHRRSRLLARNEMVEDGETALRASRKGYKVAANICIFRREAIKAIPFCRNGMNFCEDWDLFARLADSGWANIYFPKILAQYRVWTDAKGYRKGRKAIELEGIIRLFDETLYPAWERRGWDAAELKHSQRCFAKAHCASLLEIPDHSSDYDEVYKLLVKLAQDEALISRQISLLQSPMGMLMRIGDWLEGQARDRIKSFLNAFHLHK